MADVDGPRDGKATNSKLLPARDALKVIAHIDMDAFYAQIEQVSLKRAGNPLSLISLVLTADHVYRGERAMSLQHKQHITKIKQ